MLTLETLCLFYESIEDEFNFLLECRK